jgi:C4-dicarboxylate transporter DctM subunit
MEDVLFPFLILVAGLLLLLMSGMWVAVGLSFLGFLGLKFIVGGGLEGMLGVLQLRVIDNFVLCAVPLFIFMGNILLRSGIMDKVYHGISPLLSFLPGGLLHTNIGACAIFGACSGSSVAASATMGQVAMPIMKKLGYDKRLLYGSLAAGGTLSSMIPPSIAFILYGAWVGESVGALFIAGIIPGIILAGLFMAYICFSSLMHPDLTPQPERFTLREKLFSLIHVSPVVLIIFSVLGTIYIGVATPTEAAALGASAALIVCGLYRKLSWIVLKESLLGALGTCTMIFFILMGAMSFSMVISMLKIPEALSIWVVSLGLGRWMVFIAIVFLYMILGAIIDPNSMLLMTLSVTYPLMMTFGFDSIWFGVCMAVFVEMAAVTPPLGLNLFVIHGISGEESISTLIRGCLPFFILMLILLAMLYFFPDLALWLPSRVIGAY